MVPAGRLLRGAHPGLLRRQQRRGRGHPRAHRQARLPPVAGGRLPVAAALLPVAPARRRLRHQRLLLGAPRERDRRRPQAPAGRGPRPGHPGHRRPGHQPHQRPAPVVRRVAAEPGQPQGRLVRVERRRPAVAGGPGRLHRRRAVQLGLRPPAGPVLLAPLLRPPARPQLRQPRGGRRHARGGPLLARPGPRRLPARRRPLPLPAGRHRRGEPPRDPRLHPPGPGRARRATTRAGSCWPRPTGGRPTWPTTSATTTSATCASTSR